MKNLIFSLIALFALSACGGYDGNSPNPYAGTWVKSGNYCDPLKPYECTTTTQPPACAGLWIFNDMIVDPAGTNVVVDGQQYELQHANNDFRFNGIQIIIFQRFEPKKAGFRFSKYTNDCVVEFVKQ